MVSPVIELQRLLTPGETELKWLDMTIYVKIYIAVLELQVLSPIIISHRFSVNGFAARLLLA